MSLPAVPMMIPDRNKPIRGYITKCPICKKPGTLAVNLLKKVSERGKRHALCIACDFEGELFSRKIRRTPIWQPKP